MERTSWGTFFAVAAAYAACYELTRHFSYSHWILPAGLRLACLLLLPYRLWPALAFGEALPVFENAALCASRLGLAWAGISAIPFILLCMPAVRWVRNRMPLFTSDRQINMPMLLIVTLVCALITAVRTDAAVFAALTSGSGGMSAWRAEGVIDLLAYILGAYLGALTLTPVLLAAREWFDGPVSWNAVVRNRLTRDVALGVTPLLALIATLSSVTTGLGLDLCRLAVLIPVVALTKRHGWQGAAVAGLLSSITLATTSKVLLDPSMIRAQVLLALTISGALLVGARMTHYATLVPMHWRKPGVE